MDSVNGQTGAVVLNNTHVGADATGTASSAVAAHTGAADPHGDRAFSVQRSNHTGTQSAGTITGLATVATTGAYASLSGLPTLGSAAPLNTPASGNAASGEVVKGDDTRLSDSRPPTAHTHAPPSLVRVTAIAYAASITPDCGTTDVVNVGTLTGTITINAPTGTPTDGQLLTFRFTQNGTGYALTWNSAFAFGTDITSALIPITANAKFEVGVRWNSTDSKWRVVALVRGF